MTRQRNFPLSHSQLLRMWTEPSTHCPPVWRFSLEDVATGQRAGFADLDGLICHLLELMETAPATEQESRLIPESQELV